MTALDELWAQVVEKVGPERAWRPGMAARAVGAPPEHHWRLGSSGSWEGYPAGFCAGALPFPVTPLFDDDATRGALLGLAMEVGADPEALMDALDGYVHGGRSVDYAEGILRAILAAP